MCMVAAIASNDLNANSNANFSQLHNPSNDIKH